MILDSLRSIRTVFEAEEPPETGASAADHWRYVWHQIVAEMLRPRFWLIAAAVSMVLQVMER